MGHTIELPDELYRALERYAEQRGETVETTILAWATQVVSPEAQQVADPEATAMYNAAEDPLAEFLGAGELTSLDAILHHDEVFGAEGSDAHDN